MKRKFATVMGLILSLYLVSCGHPRYTPQDLMARNVKEIRGVVSKQGRACFLLVDDANGEEDKYCTGEMTQYIPENYRSQDGDQVRVSFSESWERNGKLKRTVLQLEPLNIPERNLALSEITGEIVLVGRGSSRHAFSIGVKTEGMDESLIVYIPTMSKTETMLRGRKENVGRKIWLSLRRVPILRGNDYIYEAVSANWID